MRIIFVRHGHPDYQTDTLTPLGHEQAKRAAERLSGENIEAIFSSPMGRAVQTMEKFQALFPALPVKILDFMHEINWGSFDGKEIPCDGHPWFCTDQMVERGLDLCASDWKESVYFKNNIATLEADRIAREIDEWLLTLGYSREGLYYRNCRADGDQHTVALFCHGGSSSAALAHMLNLTFPFVCATVHMDFTAVTVLRLDCKPGSICVPVAELVADARHII